MIPCIIPARGGSRGIPHKNIVPVCGLPLIAWSIEQAIAAECVDAVIVATDCDEIAAVAMHYRAQVFRRSAESATDNAPSEAVLREVVQGRWTNAEAIVFLQATSPLRQCGEIDAAVQLLRKSQADSVFSARQVVGYTWERRNGHVVPCHTRRPMRQADDVTRYEENGSIYVFRPEVLLEHNSRHGAKAVPYLMHPLDSFQIDEPDDIPLVRMLMRLREVCQ